LPPALGSAVAPPAPPRPFLVALLVSLKFSFNPPIAAVLGIGHGFDLQNLESIALSFARANSLDWLLERFNIS
jgi:hypothetical protein